MNYVSSLIRLRVNEVFHSSAQADAVLGVLDSSCSFNLPLVNRGDFELVDRIQTAVLKLSEGDVDKLKMWVDVAKADWRDVLDAAGFFGDEHAHLGWKP